MKNVVKACTTLFVIGLTVGFIKPAAAYGGIGHDAFCQLAYDLSQPATRAKLDGLVQQHPDYKNFGSLCSWADHIKSETRWDWAKPHHYVNFSRAAAKVTATDCAQSGCILSAIQHHYDVLKHDPEDWVAFAFLVHFIGDLHQPMHVSFADDLGGNRATLDYYGEPTNLHRLWDTDMLVKRGANNREQKLETLRVGLKPIAPLTVTAEQTLAWANESAAITRRIYSDYREGQKLAASYTEQWGPLLEQRMQQGAQRLAAILDGLYSE